MDQGAEALLSEGREAYRRGDYASAEKNLSDALVRGAADYADVHHTLGVIYHSWGLFAKARAAFEEALRCNPKYAEAALNLSITYNDLGRYAEAQDVLARALVGEGADQPLNLLTRAKISNLHAEVGDAYRSAGLFKEAAIEYRRALSLCPHFVDIRARLAQSLVEAGDRVEAVNELRIALADNPHYVPGLLQLGLLLQQQNDRGGAKQALERVLELIPGHERALAYLRMLEPHRGSE